MVIGTIVTVLFISVRQSQRVRDTAEGVTQTQEILNHLKELELAVVDNETASRGYVITKQDSFLQSIGESEKKLKDELTALSTVVKELQSDNHLIDSIRFYINNRVSFSRQMVAKRDAEGIDGAVALITAGVGKFYTDKVREFSDQLQHHQDETLEARKNKNAHTVNQLTITLYIILAFIFLLSMRLIYKVRSDVRYIIQRRKKEEELRKSEERFRILVDNVKDYSIYMIDSNGIIETWNRGAELLKGYSAEEIIGKPFSVFYSPADVSAGIPENNLKEAISKGHFETQGMRVRKDGSFFWAHAVITPLYDNGVLTGFAKITRDFTGQKKKDEQFALLSRQFEQTHDVIYATGTDLKVKAWNKGAEDLYGYTKEEALDQDPNKLLQSIVKPGFLDDALQQLTINNYWTGEINRKTKSGREIVVRSSTTTIKDENGAITGYVSVNMDITEQKKFQQRLKQFNVELEEQVKRKTQELTVMLERITDAFVSIDKNFVCTYVNRKAGMLMQREPSTVIGKNLRRIFPGIIGTETDKAFLEAMQTQEQVISTGYYEPLDIWYELYIYPSPDGWSVFIRNVTDKKKTEQKLQTAHQRLLFHVEKAPLGFIEWDNKLQVRSWSRRATEIFGWTETEVMDHQRSGISQVFEEYIPRLTVIARQLIEGDAERNIIQHKGYTKGGKVVWCEWFNSVIKDEKGQVITILSLVQDITERIRAEEEIKRSYVEIRISEQKYKLLFESNPMPMWMRSMEDRTIIDVNNAACIAYGYSKEEFLQLGPTSLRHPDQIDTFLEEFEKEMPYPTNRGVWKHRRKDNTYIDIEIYVQDTMYNGKKVRLILAKDVTEQLKAEDKLRSSYEEVRRLASHLREIREEERTNMSREIHDQLGQQLTVMKMDISWLHKKMLGAERPIQNRMNDLKNMMDDTVKLVRRIASDLRPSLLDDMGLIAAIEWHAAEFEKRSGIAIELTGIKTEPALSKDYRINLFRIVQESLTNVGRHSGATKVVIDLETHQNRLLLTIKDNGKGFDPVAAGKKGSLGLLGMRERAAVIGGDYEIFSAQDRGTLVQVSVSLNEAVNM
jgi:PAS domain S-box-containing protein